jgi:spermidine/putrescine transport system permease protein
MKRLLRAYVFFIFAFLYLPILVLVLYSWNKDRISSSWGGFTGDWYRQLFDNHELWDAFQTSLIIAFLSAAISVVIGTLTSYALYKFDYRGKRTVQAVLNLPVITPDIVLGIGILSFFSVMNLTTGLFSILLAHVTFNIAYTTMIVSTRFTYMDPNLEYAAADLGARPPRSFMLVVVPNIMPGIITAFLIAFTLSWDDFIVAFLTAGVGVKTLPIFVYSMIRKGVDPQINAVCTITLLISILLIGVALRFQKISKFLTAT